MVSGNAEKDAEGREGETESVEERRTGSVW